MFMADFAKMRNFDFAVFCKTTFQSVFKGSFEYSSNFFCFVSFFPRSRQNQIKRLLAHPQVVKICQTCVLMIHVLDISYIISNTKFKTGLTRTVRSENRKKLKKAQNRSISTTNRFFCSKRCFCRICIMRNFWFCTLFCKTPLSNMLIDTIEYSQTKFFLLLNFSLKLVSIR